MSRSKFACRRTCGGFTSLAIALALVLPASASAQATGSVTGVLTNAVTGEVIAGGQISVVGSTIGTLTNNVGRYLLLNVPSGPQMIRAEFIGYGAVEQSVTVPSGGSVVLDLRIRSEAISLEGLVVTGTAGAARKREVGNSISQINAAQIEAAPIADLGDLLQGRATGLMVQDNTGAPGAGNRIRLRGNNSISQGNNPLVYVDGIRVNSEAYPNDGELNQSPSPIQDINPDDIERVEIIKGAAATTLYGTEAAGGVIQIFTKRGAAGAPAWTFNMDQGVNQLGHIGPDKEINPTGLGFNDCTDQAFCPEDGDWLQNGYIQNYSLSVRGGTETTNYFLSGSYGTESGAIDSGQDDDPDTQEAGQESWSLRGNFGFNPSDNVTIRFNNSYNHRAIDWIPDGNNAEGFTLNVLRRAAGYTDDDNSVVFTMKPKTLIDHFTSGVNLVWTQASNITHRFNAGLDWSQADFQNERPWGFWYREEGNREVDVDQNRKLTIDYAGTWNTNVTDGITSAFSAGGQLYDDFFNRTSAFGEQFAGPGDKEIDSGALTSASETRRSVTNGGFFAQEMIGFNDQLFITGGLRVDGHSTFGDDFGWQWYPKISASYIISDNDFWPESLGEMKLRSAYGESGKAPGFFDAEKTWESVSGDDAQPGVEPSNLGNPELGPERTQEFEFGLEGSILNGRIQYEYTYYKQTTIDALVPVQQVPSSGFTGTQLENVGEVQNWGHEIAVAVNAVRLDNVNWDLDLRFSTNESEVIDLGGLQEIGLAWRNAILPGEPLPVFCNNRVQNPNEVGAIPDVERECLGPLYPKYSYGIGSNITIGQRLTLDFLGEGQAGHWLSAGTAYQTMRRGTWPTCLETQANLDNDAYLAGITAEERAKCDRRYSSYGTWTQKADFFKIRSAGLSYRVPESMLPGNIGSLVLRLQGRNLWTSTDYEGLDPEAHEDGSSNNLYQQEYYQLPPLRSFILSVKVNF
jgi:TonB-dependent SusC/RagA subfamily outer membrane receptor